MKYRIVRSTVFLEWFNRQTAKEQFQILKRLFMIETDAHFGEHKKLAEDLYELKWINGRRIYYSIHKGELVVLLVGGNKNGQNQDINEAKRLLKKYLEG